MEKIENNSQGVLALTNKIRMEAKGVKDIGIPLDAFPQKLQDIIFEVARIEQFDLEYLTLSMLSHSHPWLMEELPSPVCHPDRKTWAGQDSTT